jgi:hypothetical protein
MATTKRRDGDEPQPEDMKKADAPKVDADEMMISKKDADAAYAEMEAKHTKMIGALEQMVADMAKQLAVLKAAESAEVAEADVPEAVADSIVSKRLAKLDSAREGARLVAPAVKLDGLLKPREIHAAAIAAAMPTMKLDGLSDDGVAGVFAGIVEPARARAAKRADGGRKVADVLVPNATQAEEVARADGEAAPLNPIEDQQAALRSWSQRPAVSGKKAP